MIFDTSTKVEEEEGPFCPGNLISAEEECAGHFVEIRPNRGLEFHPVNHEVL